MLYAHLSQCAQSLPRGPFSPPFLGPCVMGRATSLDPLAPHSRIELAPPVNATGVFSYQYQSAKQLDFRDAAH